ncbi:MAG TPA: SagB/ThcOx family dehydrogenase [Desulfomonilia bacterium]|nr:SagB/ThcOx family dehydrogenase [Desulfomonilia bacterium]
MQERTAVYVTRRTVLQTMARITAVLPLMPIGTALGKALEQCKEGKMNLPEPKVDGKVSVEKAIRDRRTVRSFSPRTLNLEQISQLLWSAQGITEQGGFKRAAPSAGALYPMELFIVVGRGTVEHADPGIYHYEAGTRSTSLILEGDHRDELARASLSQFWMAKAPVNLVITAEFRRITGKYGSRGERYALIEAGHIAQNIFLQARALGLAAGIVGAFTDTEIKRILQVDAAIDPLLIMPVGYPKE